MRARGRAKPQDVRDAGPLQSLIPLVEFVDDSTFLTKSSSVGVVYRLTGVDYEGATAETMERVVHRFLAALRPFDETFEVMQYIDKRRVPPFTAGPCAHPVAAEAIERYVGRLNARRESLYLFDLYVVLLAHGTAPRTFTWSSRAKAVADQDADLDRHITRLHRAADGFAIAIADVVAPVRLPKREAWRFLRRLVNLAPHIIDAPLVCDDHLDYFLGDTPVDYEPDHLVLGGQTVKLLSMKAPPSRSFAHMLHDLDRIPCEFLACLDWQRMAAADMQSTLKWRRRFYDGKGLLDASAVASAAQVGAAQTDLDVHGRAFGHCSLTVRIADADPRVVDEAAAFAIKVLAAADGVLIEETHNLPNAWLAMIPGNRARNVRAPQLALMDVNLADLSFVFTLDRGHERSAHLNAPALAVFETETETPYFFNLHHQDVGHQLIVGSTGGGKSTLASFEILAAQQYHPFTVIFDVGGHYQPLVTALNGRYLALGMHTPGVTLNPFALPKTDENLHFLTGFVRVLLEARREDGTISQPLEDWQERDVYEEVEALYSFEPAQRRLGSLLLHPSLQPRLEPWRAGGRFPIFDHAEDTLVFEQIQGFDFQAMQRYPQVLQPLAFYAFHRIRAQVGRGFVLAVWDESWLQISHPVIAGYIREAMKTWRKSNAMLILITQSLKDFESAGLLDDVLQNCHTKLILADKWLDRAFYAEKLKLNEAELDAIASLTPKRQFFLKRPDVSKVLTLRLEPDDLRLYTNEDQPVETV